MDRNREARRASIVGSNGFNRRRHRTNSLRDSPDEDGGVELQESVRLRERVKKERDRDRDRERDRERERERDLRERSSRSKRRRAERLNTNSIGGGDETSDESVNDEDDEDEDEESTTTAAAGVASGSVRLSTPPVHLHHHSSSFSQQQLQQHNSNSNNNTSSSIQHLQHRKSFPPPQKVFRAPPVWKSGDEMISSTVPRKARSASTKRSHDWISSSSNNNSGGAGAGGEQQICGQASYSPARQGLVSATPLPPAAAPLSPSSSNASMRKKLKPSVNQPGPKLKPPKVASKPSSSSNPEELEIEIAEVLYGLMTQSQGPSSKKEDSRELNRLNTDAAKSRNSSPVSNTNAHPNSSPLSAVAPKRKRPRQVPENAIHGGAARKPDSDQTPKAEISSPNAEKSRSEAENGGGAVGNTFISAAEISRPTPPEAVRTKPAVAAEEIGESRDLVAKEEVSSPLVEKLSPAMRAEEKVSGDSAKIATASSATTMIKASLQSEAQNQKEEKFEIDLMAPPPQARSSPEMENKADSMTLAMDLKPVLSTNEMDLKPLISKNEEMRKVDNSESGRGDHSAEEKRGEMNKAVENIKGRNNNNNIDLQLHLEKPKIDGSGSVAVNASKLQFQAQKQQMPLKASRDEPLTEKSGHPTSSLPLPLSMASWPGGLPPMGYMAPLQGVIPIDGATVTPAHLQPALSLPRPKRCATHCHIARNIHCLQQFMKMNPYMSAAHAASMFGSKPPALNVLPPADLHGNLAIRAINNNSSNTNPTQDSKGQQVLGGSANHTGKEKGSQSAMASADSAQRKQQILIQQAMPPVAPPSNLLGPAFIFPLNQPQTAPSARPSTAKSPTTAGASPNPSSSAGTVPSSSAPTPPMGFPYPNMAPNETQYLAILQNNAYPFPIQAAVGAPPPNYRGAPAQAMPLFNGSFYSSQMIHPSQLQQQPLSTAHNQNASPSSGSSSSHQKHLQQQRPQSSGSGNASMQNFTSQKTQPSHSNNQYMQGGGGEDNNQSATTDSRGSRPTMNIYGQNFAMPIHPQSFALMTPPTALASTTTASSNNQSEKKVSHQAHQQTGLKSGVNAESLPPHSFAMSFGPMNGTAADMAASMAQSHAAIFQNSPEGSRQNIQMMAAAAVAAQVAQKKTFRASEDLKPGGGADSSSSKDDDRKSFASKSHSGVGGQQSTIAFARSDLADATASGQANSSGGGSSRGSWPGSNANVGPANMIQNAHFQAHQQMMQLKQQQHQHQQQLVAASRSKMAAEHLMNSSSSPSSAMAKFPNALSGFPQNLVQSNSNNSSTTTPRRDKSPPKWKRPSSTSQAPSSLGTSAGTPITNLVQHMQMQQNNRAAQPQMHGQISFGGNQKQPSASGGPVPPPPSSSSPMMVGSPTTSSISKGGGGGGGSPRTTSSASTNNGKMGQAQAASSLSPQPTKNPPSINPSQKSPSILGNPHNISSSSSNSAAKTTHLQQQQQQSQLPKSMQHAQLFFSNPYNQSQSPHSAGANSTNSAPNGYYMTTRRRPDTQGSNTNDPAIAIANATSNAKGGGFSPQGMIHASQLGGPGGGPLLHTGYSYVHPVPAAVQVKPAEQKQATGNENLHTWQPEKK